MCPTTSFASDSTNHLYTIHWGQFAGDGGNPSTRTKPVRSLEKHADSTQTELEARFEPGKQQFYHFVLAVVAGFNMIYKRKSPLYDQSQGNL